MKELRPQDVEPLHDRLLVRRHAPPQETQGGLALSDLSGEVAKAGIQRGTVIAVGDGKKMICSGCDGTGVESSWENGYDPCCMGCDKGVYSVPPQCKVGDVVVFGRWGGIDVGLFDLDGQEVLVMPECEVLAVEYEVPN